MKTVVLLLLISSAWAQSLPDAPSACVSHGKPCPEWLHKLIGPYPVPPDQKYEWMHFDVAPAHFFTFRKLGEPALKPDKKCKAIFWGSVGLSWIALATTNHQKEPWHSEAAALAGVNAMGYLGYKFFSPSIGTAPQWFAAGHYFNAR